MLYYGFNGDQPENEDPHAVVLELSDEDSDALHHLPNGITLAPIPVTDQASGTRYLVGRADCGLGCVCAMLAVRFTHGARERFFAYQAAVAEARLQTELAAWSKT